MPDFIIFRENHMQLESAMWVTTPRFESHCFPHVFCLTVKPCALKHGIMRRILIIIIKCQVIDILRLHMH